MLSQSALVSAGTPLSVGGVVSTASIVCVAEVSLPHRSVAVHVRRKV